MDRERRQAERSKLPEPLPVRIGVTAGRLLDLSMIGARVEHEEKLTVGSMVDLELQGVRFKGRVARSEISGRKGGALVYQSGIHFSELTPEASGAIAVILRGPEPAKPAAAQPAPASGSSLFFQADDEETMPYIMLRFRENRWSKHYTATPQQPDEGLTISRDQANEIDMLQRTYETADPETRQMMRIAMAAQLGG
ncbi:MAG TPA: PilZ domain-containing protein [Thermoanaerobaculia bacterium]|nr:PilZ domain-containing protein [Thermoanaerobaculia bacterium]